MFNKDTHSLVLRACSEDMSSKNNFKWPTSGVEDGLEPDTFYKLDENNNFTTCE